MSVDDGPADGEAHAHARGLGRVERLEDAVHVRRIEPRARIPDRDEHGVRAISPGPDQQLSLSSAAAVHRFDSVEDQVEDHLLHLRAIALHAGQSRREVRLQRDAMSEHFTSGHGDHFEDGFVEIEPLPALRRLLDQGMDPADDVAGAFAVPDDLIERLADLVQIRRTGAQPA